jgi:DNA-binding LacI/PurR family transcriptional regulator
VATGIKDVAKHAGVSVGTVSNVLNRPHLVAEATRDRIRAAMAELGYVRNESARQLRAGHGRFIGLIVLDITNPFFADVTRGAEESAEEAGFQVSVWNSGEDPARERRHLELLLEQRVEGVLITPAGDDVSGLGEFDEFGIPVVLVDRGAAHADRCSVAVDDELGGRLAIRHLLEQGHEHIAFIGGPLAIDQVKMRLLGVEAELAEHTGSATLTVVETAALQLDEGTKALHEVLEITPRPSAIFCANDLLALGALRGCTDLGLSVPEDIAIVGYDDIAFAAGAAVPLTSVRQPREELGRQALQLLLDERSNPNHQHRQTLFRPTLVVRSSTQHRSRNGHASDHAARYLPSDGRDR